MPDYPLAKLRSDQPCLWLPLALPACLLACRAAPGESTTFEVSRFEGEQDAPTFDTLTIVHADEAANTTPALSASASEEWLQVAAAVVISALLRSTTGQRIQRVSRSDSGLDFYLETPNDEQDCLLSVVGSSEHDTQEALGHATEHANSTPCAHKIAAAVAFGSGKAAVRVLS